MSHLNLDLTLVGISNVSLVVAMLSITGCLLLYLLQLTAVKVFLELMATDFGTPVAEGLKIDFRMSHQDIANAIGSTRVSITRILSKLRETGWLIKTDGFLIVIAS